MSAPLRSAWAFSRDLVQSVAGYAAFAATGETPAWAARAFRALTFQTNNRINDAFAAAVRPFHPSYDFPLEDSILPGIDGAEIEHAVDAVRERGIYVFRERVPESVCDELDAYTRRTPGMLFPARDEKNPEHAVFDRARPQAPGCYYLDHSLYHLPATQRLITEPAFLRVCQSYLGQAPVFAEGLRMWWSAPHREKYAASRMAQLYHVDMSRIRFLLFFIYLVDVDERNGPFTYVLGSHRRKPPACSRDGRLEDELVLSHYPREAIFPATGPRGTIFVADNRGLHKGREPESGSRLAFQLEYAVDHFFAPYRHVPLDGNFAPWFLEKVRRHPFTYSRFTGPR